jgi:hypothetical protein
MPTGTSPDAPRESGTTGRNNPRVHSVLAMCLFLQRNHAPRTTTVRGDGVSTYLALTFGTLLSSQRTEAAIRTVSPAPPGFPFVVFPTLSDTFQCLTPSQRGRLSGPSAVPTSETLADPVPPGQIGPVVRKSDCIPRKHTNARQQGDDAKSSLVSRSRKVPAEWLPGDRPKSALTLGQLEEHYPWGPPVSTRGNVVPVTSVGRRFRPSFDDPIQPDPALPCPAWPDLTRPGLGPVFSPGLRAGRRRPAGCAPRGAAAG